MLLRTDYKYGFGRGLVTSPTQLVTMEKYPLKGYCDLHELLD
jgi:hypothetical protein